MKNEVNRALVAKKKFCKSSLTLLAGFLLTFAFPVQGWAHGTTTHYGKIKVTASGEGSVYIGTTDKATSGNTEETWNCGGKSNNDSKTYFLFATPNSANHYYFDGWSGNGESSTDNPWEVTTGSATSTDANNGTPFTYTANFLQYPEFIFKAHAKLDKLGTGTGQMQIVYSQGAAPSYSDAVASVFVHDKNATQLSNNVTFTAYPDDNMNFDGWYDETGTLLSSELSYTAPPQTSKKDNPAELTCYARFMDPSKILTPSIFLASKVSKVTLQLDEIERVIFDVVDERLLTAEGLFDVAIENISYEDEGETEPIIRLDYSNPNDVKIVANRAGEAKVTFHHPLVSGIYEEAYFTFTFIIKKKDAIVTWIPTTILVNESRNVSQLVSSNSTGAWSIASSLITSVITTDGTSIQAVKEGFSDVTFHQEASTQYNALTVTKRYYVYDSNNSFAVFTVNGKDYTDLNEANKAAEALSSNRYVVLKNSGVLPTGDYTISSKVTLFIPHSENYTSYITTPEKSEQATFNITAYRTLIMENGANIDLYGKLCIGAVVQSGDASHVPSGFPVGNVGCIDMGRGGHIDVENGATLYAWGFVTGRPNTDGANVGKDGTVYSGTITAKNGAIIYECFGLGDWGGGSYCSAAGSNDKSYRIFPFQNYFVQNIEVPLRMEYGANEKLYSIIYLATTKTSQEVKDVPFIGTATGVFFRVNSTNGVVTKWYDATTDHLVVELEGDARLDNLKMNVYNIDIEAKDFDLPVLSNMYLKLKNCTLNLTSPLMLQPNAVVEIEQNSNVVLSSKLFVYDKEEWGKFVKPTKYFTKIPNILTPHYNLGDGSSKTNMNDAQLIVDGTFTIAEGGALYTTKSHADIMGNNAGHIVWNRTLPGNDVTNGYLGTGVNTELLIFNYLKPESIVTNDCSAAWMHNENKTYTKPISLTTFDNIHGRWFTHTAATTLNADQTYNFTYDNNGSDATVKAIYSPDKTGIEFGYKWVNVTTDSEHANTFLGDDGNLYNYTTNEEWLQLIAIGNGVYGGSDNNLYAYNVTSGKWESVGEIDDDCLYTVDDTKKALVGSTFIEIVPNSDDEAYHNKTNTSEYYLAFDGCVWQKATKVASKAYTLVAGGTYVWMDEWVIVDGKDGSLFYIIDNQNIKQYYEYSTTEYKWVPAQMRVSVEAAGNVQTFPSLPLALNHAKTVNNPVVALLKDINDDASRTISSAMTFDLNGHTLNGTIASGTGGSVKAYLTLSANVTITDNSMEKNGVISVVKSQDCHVTAVSVTGGTFKMHEGNIYCKNASTGTNARAYGLYIEGGSPTIEGGTIEAERSAQNAYGVYSSTGPVLTIIGGTIRGTATTNATAAYSNKQMIVSGGTFIATATNVDGTANALNGGSSNTSDNTISGGYFKASNANGAYRTANMGGSGKFIFSGGYFNHNGRLSEAKYDLASGKAVRTLPSDHAEYANGYRYSIENGYTVTFLDDDNTTILKTIDPAFVGDMPSCDDPTKAEDAQYTYTFKGWTPAIAVVTGTATYTATYNQTLRSYTITWQDENGVELSHETVKYGVVPTHAALTKAADAQYTYTWKGWNTTPVAVTGDATYKSLGFTANLRSYTITWQDENGVELSHETVNYGVVPTHADLTKDADAQYTYTWKGWNTTPVAVTGDATYKSLGFTANLRSYTITFQNEDGAELQKSDVEYGATPTYNGATPTKTATAEYTYTFEGWTPAIVAVTGDATYTATYTATAVPTTAKYRVMHYKLHIKFGEKFAEPFWNEEFEEVAVGTKVTPDFKEIEGYDNPAEHKTITISANPNENVVIYEYPISKDNTLNADGEITTETEAYTVVLAPGKTMNITETGSVTAKNLVLQSKPGDNTGANLATTSGLDILGKVCIEIEMNSTGKMNDKLYYCFSVPFAVNVADGVKRLHKTSGEWESAVLNTNYLVYTYNEYDRATNGRSDNNWTLFSGDQFVPGVFYLCEFDNSNYNRYRFYAADKNNLNNKGNIAVTHTGDATNGGWNGVANNGLTDNQLSGDFTYIQTLNSVKNSFESAKADEKPLAIGNAAMVQVSASGSVVVGETSSAVAARRMGEAASTEFINVRLYKENQNQHVDQIFIRASEDAAEQYVAGIDLSKATMGTPKVARLWVNDYDLQLVANEALMINDQATFSLGMSAPANGEYTIAIDDTPNDAIVYLTMNGSAIWNLNIAPAPISLSKGTENSYGLRLVRKINNVVTGLDEAVLNGNVQKVILNDHLYIIRDGKVYSAHGHVIK